MGKRKRKRKGDIERRKKIRGKMNGENWTGEKKIRGKMNGKEKLDGEKLREERKSEET